MSLTPNSVNPPSIRKIKRESLLEVQKKYQSLIDNLEVGVYRNTAGSEGHFLEANTAMINMFQANSKEEFLRHNVSDFYQDPSKRKEFVNDLMKKGKVHNKVIDMVTLKGNKITISVTAVMKKDNNGEAFFDGIVEDITHHKKMEDTLIKYRDSLELQVKERTIQLEKLNRTLTEEIKERERIQKSLVVNNNNLENIKKAMLNVMEDLAEAKGTIEFEKAKVVAMLDCIGEGLIGVDANRKIILINKSAEKMLGWKSKTLLGKNATSLILESDDGQILPVHKRPISIALTKGEMTEGTYFFQRKDKTKFPAGIIVTPIKLNKKIIGAIDIFRDITIEQEIIKAKNEFVSLASHQLRTPMGIIKWYLENLESEDYIIKAPSEIKKNIAEIIKNNERVLGLVRDLLSVSRIDQGSVKNTPRKAIPILIVKEIVNQMKIIAQQKKVTLQLIIKDKSKLSIMIDDLRLHEVVENLVTNAIKYTLPGGSVIVTLDRVGGTLIIQVKDTGIGISLSDQKKLFTKFFRSSQAVSLNPEGSGLGLYLVKSYVQGWGGKISVKSTEGVGSIVIINLPIRNKIV